MPPEDQVMVAPAKRPPDAHGQAALLLAESILHMLIQTGSFTTADALATVGAAAEVKVEIALLAEENQEVMLRSLALLNRIRESLMVDERDVRDNPGGDVNMC